MYMATFSINFIKFLQIPKYYKIKKPIEEKWKGARPSFHAITSWEVQAESPAARSTAGLEAEAGPLKEMERWWCFSALEGSTLAEAGDFHCCPHALRNLGQLDGESQWER
jgi:hypothetical protein